MATPAGLEPTHVSRNRFLVDPLNRSGTVSHTCTTTHSLFSNAICCVGITSTWPLTLDPFSTWVTKRIKRAYTESLDVRVFHEIVSVWGPASTGLWSLAAEARIVVFDVDDPKRVEGMLEPDTAHFESVFETGNLRAAVRVRTYDCSGVPSTTLHDQVCSGVFHSFACLTPGVTVAGVRTLSSA
jgi:hypothetical protein